MCGKKVKTKHYLINHQRQAHGISQRDVVASSSSSSRNSGVRDNSGICGGGSNFSHNYFNDDNLEDDAIEIKYEQNF